MRLHAMINSTAVVAIFNRCHIFENKAAESAQGVFYVLNTSLTTFKCSWLCMCVRHNGLFLQLGDA